MMKQNRGFDNFRDNKIYFRFSVNNKRIKKREEKAKTENWLAEKEHPQFLT